MSRSIGVATQQAYRRAVAELTRWCENRKLCLSIESLDEILEQYFDFLYFAGSLLRDGRYAMYGFAFLYDVPMDKTLLPRAFGAPRGWKICSPETARDAEPWEVAVAVAAWLARSKLPHAMDAARRHILQFDGFLRPSEALGLTWDSVFPPWRGSTANQCWAIIARPNDTVAEGSNTDLAAAAQQVPRAAPAKTGVHDNTVLFGEAASVKAGRGLIVPLLRRWYYTTRGRRTHLFSLTLSRYEALLGQAFRALKLHALKLCAHSARHGGASVDSVVNVRSIAQIQARGCWDSPESVARYREPGTYARQVSLIPEALMRGHAATLAALTRLLS